jgi:DNA polymerase-3 subunit delta'
VTFADVIGQKELKQQLASMVTQNRVSHAMLFLGHEGSGGLVLARAFAQYLLCEKVRSAGMPSLFGESSDTIPADSCGQCSSCQKAATCIHPDIHYSFPVITGKKGDKPLSAEFMEEWRQFVKEQPYGNNYDWLQFIDAENKQGNITAFEVADINRKMNLKSFEGSYKILILWMPEFLGKEGNKLLKLIEEPPSDTIFLLVAENEALILPTILSRTHLIKLRPLTKLEIEAALELRQGTPTHKAQQLAILSEGNYREALQQLQHADDDWDALLREWMNCILRTGPVAQVKWIEDIAKIGREKQKQFLRYFNHLIELSVRRQIMPVPITPGSREDDFTTRLNKLCGMEQLEAISNELDQAAYHIERNANAKILFHSLTIKLYHIISNKSVILMH